MRRRLTRSGPVTRKVRLRQLNYRVEELAETSQPAPPPLRSQDAPPAEAEEAPDSNAPMAITAAAAAKERRLHMMVSFERSELRASQYPVAVADGNLTRSQYGAAMAVWSR